jgi:hypothetical protein
MMGIYTKQDGNLNIVTIILPGAAIVGKVTS